MRSPALPNLDGVLGSDTLSSFGAVRIDYRQQALTLGPQIAPLRSDVAGGSGPPSVPAPLADGTSFASPMPVKVVSKTLSPDHLRLTEVRPTVDLSFGPDRFTLTLDTGAGTTNLAPSVVNELGLAPVGRTRRAYAGLDCPVVVNHYTMGPATLGKVQLPSQTVGSNFTPSGTEGVLGSGTLANYSPVLVDYTDGELFLGQGEQAQPARRRNVPSRAGDLGGWSAARKTASARSVVAAAPSTAGAVCYHPRDAAGLSAYYGVAIWAGQGANSRRYGRFTIRGRRFFEHS